MVVLKFLSLRLTGYLNSLRNIKIKILIFLSSKVGLGVYLPWVESNIRFCLPLISMH